MIRTSEQAKKYAELAKINRPPRGKSKTTIIREQVMREHAEKNLGRINEASDVQYDLMKLPLEKKKPNAKIAEVKLKAAETIINRAIGKPLQQTDITSGGMPIPILAGLFEEEN